MSTRRNFIKQSISGSIIIASGMPGLYLPSVYPEIRRSKEKPRIIIETDAGGDPDDEQSLVRFLVYADVFEILGIIANRPVTRRPENKNPQSEGYEIVKAMINAYGKCFPNLVQHSSGYPKPGDLLKLTRPGYNTDAGVDLIIKAVDSDETKPLWFCNWGTDNGSSESCLKRALDKIMRERGNSGYAKFKNRIFLSSADKFGDHTNMIDPPFPFWIDTWRPPVSNKRWYHRFSPVTAKAGGFDIERDVRTDHGPLGAMYPLNTNYPQKEGDTMSFLYLIPTGMNNPYEPLWGSWVGRYGLNEEHPGKNYYWANQEDNWNNSRNRDNMLARWAEAFQNDFRVRMDWCVKPYAETNHHPVAIVNGKKGIIHLTVKPGKMVILDAHRSYDPDKRELLPLWFIYNEAGTCREEITLNDPNSMRASFIAPKVKKNETVHVIFQLRNNGDPSLYNYSRAIITIRP